MPRRPFEPNGPAGSGGNGPEDLHAAFAEIVADLEREGLGAALDEELASGREPGDDTAATADTGDLERPRATAGPDTPAPPQRPTDWRTSDTDWDWAWSSDTEHYVPPDPPPLPRLRAGTIVALLLAVIGIFLLVAPGLIGLTPMISAPIALILLATALGLLLLRIRSGPPPGADGDDGAQV